MSLSNPDSLSESKIIMNSKENHLYSHDFENNGTKKGKYFSVVRRDEQSALVQVSAWIQLKIVYIYDIDEISGFEITKIKKKSSKGKYEETTEKITLSKASLSDIVAFADFIKSVDLKGISERRIKLGDESFDKLDDDTKKKLKTLLSIDDGQAVILALLNEGAITSLDIVNVGYRKRQLVIFSKLLENESNWKLYAKSEKEKGEKFDDTKEEKVWQHFFKKNPWIFGYGLDYKYLEILQHESTVRGSDVSGKGAENLDALAATTDYTVLVELKKPSTELFEASQNRSNSWRLSSNLFAAVSQILEYKASHIVEWENESKKYDADENKISQKALDPKTVLVIGRDSMFSGTEKEIDIKKKTFELYCRDSRNIKILTYNDLYRRARYIVERAEK
jgi:hypothetical protein